MTQPTAVAEMVDTASLRAWPQNPRKNDGEPVARVADSIRRFGFAAPIVARLETREIIAGHTRWKAAQLLKMTQVPVRFVDLDERQAHLLALADNRLGELAEWDTPELHALLASYDVGEQMVAGWTDKDMRELERATRSEDPVDQDVVPEVPKNPVTKPGDLWVFGDHRLVCGDCRDAAVVARVLGADRVNVAFTSPPYASQRKYDESSGFEPIAADDYVAWFDAVQANVRGAIAPDGSWFVNIKAGADGIDTHLYVMDLVIAHVRRWGWHFATEFCWERVGVPKNVTQRFKNQFEPIYQFTLGKWKMRPDAVRTPSESVPVAGGAGVGNTTWGDDRQGHGKTLFGTSKVARGLAYPGNRLPPFASTESFGHSAAFPVGLPNFFVQAYSDPHDVVFDPFMGSGTTLIAAARADRLARGVELSPGYCDVVVERWQRLTDGKAQRQSG